MGTKTKKSNDTDQAKGAVGDETVNTAETDAVDVNTTTDIDPNADPVVGDDSVDGPDASDGDDSTPPEGTVTDVGTGAPEVQDPPPPVQVAEPVPHHIAFFEQFIELTKARKADQGIKAFNNSLKSMFDVNTEAAFTSVYKLFKNSDVLTVNTALQSAAILPHSDRSVVEVVFTIFHILKTNQKDASVNLDLVRTLTKNEKFVVWCTKKLQK